MTPAPAGGLLWLAALAWGLSLLRPGWTRPLGRSLWRNRWRWAALLAGLLAVGAADPLIRAAPGAALRAVTLALTGPDLLARLTWPLLATVALVLPVRVDFGSARSGATTTFGLLLGTGRGLFKLSTWAGAALAALLAARATAPIWSAVLGGELAPPLRRVAGLLLGVAAPEGVASAVDPRLPDAVYWVAGATALAVAGARWSDRRWPTGPAAGRAGRAVAGRRLGLAWAWGLGSGLAAAAVLGAAPPAALAAGPAVWWTGAILLWLAGAFPAAPLLLTGVLLLAFQQRWDFVVATPGWALPLSLDAQSYFDEALDLDRFRASRGTNLLALFFSGSTLFREPFFIYLLHNWLHAVGTLELHSVFLTMLASVAWVAVSAVAVAALLGRSSGVVTALLLAVDAVWIRNAPLGLREEVTGTLLVLCVAVLWSERARRAHLDWLAPLLAAGAALTRLDALPCALFVMLWGAVAQRWAVPRALAMAGLLGIVLVPALAGYARTRGEISPASTFIATNNWKEEFKDRLGQPGFEADRRVTAFEYVFRYHTPPQLVRYTLGGYLRIFGREVFESHYYLLANASPGWGRYVGLHSLYFTPTIFALGTIGLLSQWRRWRRAWLVPALCVVGVLPPIGFVAGVPGHSALYQARYAYMVAPFAAATVAWALVAAGSWVASLTVVRRSVDGLRRWPGQRAGQAQRTTAMRPPPSPAANGSRIVGSSSAVAGDSREESSGLALRRGA